MHVLVHDFRGKVVAVVQVEFFKNSRPLPQYKYEYCTTVQLYSAAYGCKDLSTGVTSSWQASGEKINILCGAAI